MKKNKKKMDELVNNFVEKFTHKIDELLSDQDAQMGNRIVLKKLNKCKSRLTKALQKTPCDSVEEHEILINFDDEWEDYVDSAPAIPMIDDDTANSTLPLLGGDKEAFLSNMMSHLFNMQTLVDNTLMRNLKDVLTPPLLNINRSSFSNQSDAGNDSEGEYDQYDVENPKVDDSEKVEYPDIESPTVDVESGQDHVENDQNLVENTKFDVEHSNLDLENVEQMDVESSENDVKNDKFDVDGQSDDESLNTMDERTGDNLV